MKPFHARKPIIKNGFHGFTLVELIVVITILAILGTIGFISIQEYSSSARDSSRISNLVNLQKGLTLGKVVSGTFPMPETPMRIYASGTVIGYQGFAKDQIANLAKLSAGSTKDPLDPSIFTTYTINAAQTKMQVMSFLEDGSKVTGLSNGFGVGESYAAANTNYASRSPTSKGDTLGILLGSTGSAYNQPVQELLTATFTGIDVVSTSTGYTAVFSKTDVLSGTGSKLKVLNSFMANGYAKSCSDLLQIDGNAGKNGIYTINPTGTAFFQAYCDMTTDGGGWTQVFYSNSNNVPRSAVSNNDWTDTNPVNFSRLWSMKDIKTNGLYEFFVKDSSTVGRYAIFTQTNAYNLNPVGNSFVQKSGNFYYSSTAAGTLWKGLGLGNFGNSAMNDSCTLSMSYEGSSWTYCLQDQYVYGYNTGPWFYDITLNPGTGYDAGAQQWVTVYQR